MTQSQTFSFGRSGVGLWNLNLYEHPSNSKAAGMQTRV